jgi:hypothetical protein
VATELQVVVLEVVIDGAMRELGKRILDFSGLLGSAGVLRGAQEIWEVAHQGIVIDDQRDGEWVVRSLVFHEETLGNFAGQVPGTTVLMAQGAMRTRTTSLLGATLMEANSNPLLVEKVHETKGFEGNQELEVLLRGQGAAWEEWKS